MKHRALAVLSAGIFTLVFALPALAQLKTARECNAEYATNQTQIRANKETKSAFIKQCRTEAATAPTPTVATPAPTAATAARRAPSAAGKAAGANEFTTEAAAKGRCPGDTVVWVNTASHIYHFAGTRDYGSTKSGAYMCERDTAAAGDRAAKNEKHP